MKHKVIIFFLGVMICGIISQLYIKKAAIDVESSHSSTMIDETKEINDNPKYDKAILLFHEFLDNKRKATCSDGSDIGIRDIVIPKGEEDRHYWSKYTLFDVSKDGLPELHIKSARYYYIFQYQDNQLVEWGSLSRDYELLNNGRFLYTVYYGLRTSHGYCYIDEYGKEIYEISFSKNNIEYNGNKEYVGYIFQGAEVSQERWEVLTEPYLAIGTDEIEWIIIFEETN